MAHDAWVGDYYLQSSGAMATNAWVGSYYVGEDGKWIPGYGLVWYKNGSDVYHTDVYKRQPFTMAPEPEK